MVSGPVFEGGATTTQPAELLNQYEMPPLGGLVDFPQKRNLKSFVKKTTHLTEELAEFGFRIYQDTSPDLFFICFLTLDRIKHFLWRYCDLEDPTYPGKNEFSAVIKESYFLLDSLIGRFRKIKKDNTVLLIISDHGHGRRCTKVFNLNEFLRQEGYLFTNIKNRAVSPLYLTEKLKVAVLNFLDRIDMQDLAFKLVKFIPGRKSLKKSSYIINKEESIAYTSELCSTNPHGGIDINRNKIGNDKYNYTTLCHKIIDQLMKIKDPNTGHNIVKWAKIRDEMFTGEFIEKYPDIVFELKEDYGVN
jgi:predicted AlkP superfamily phosphohydrolase/phosphomutase